VTDVTTIGTRAAVAALMMLVLNEKRQNSNMTAKTMAYPAGAPTWVYNMTRFAPNIDIHRIM
jgi:hypothetical protein